MSQLTLTAVICTRNRGPRLGIALESLVAQKGVDPDRVDVLVVDNGSTDNTMEVAESFRERLPFQLNTAFEPRMGVSFARNKSLEVATGDIVAYMDDDAIAREDWIAGHIAAYESNDKMGGVMGRIIPIWEGDRPQWLDPLLESYLTVVDHGEESFPLEGTGHAPVGANMSFLRKAIDDVGGFDPNFGFGGLKKIPHEENDIALRMQDKGWHLVYWPQATVQHGVPADRMTLKWFRRRVFDQGRADYFFDLKHHGKGTILRKAIFGGVIRTPVLGAAAILDLALGKKARAARRGSIPLYCMGYISAIGSTFSKGSDGKEATT